MGTGSFGAATGAGRGPGHRSPCGGERGNGTGARTRSAGAASLLSRSGAQPCRAPPHRGTAGRPAPSPGPDGAGGLGPTLLCPPAHCGQWWQDTELHGTVRDGPSRAGLRAQALLQQVPGLLHLPENQPGRQLRARGNVSGTSARGRSVSRQSHASSFPAEFTAPNPPLVAVSRGSLDGEQRTQAWLEHSTEPSGSSHNHPERPWSCSSPGLTCWRVMSGSQSVQSTTWDCSTRCLLVIWLCSRRRAASSLSPSLATMRLTAWQGHRGHSGAWGEAEDQPWQQLRGPGHGSPPPPG